MVVRQADGSYAFGIDYRARGIRLSENIDLKLYFDKQSCGETTKPMLTKKVWSAVSYQQQRQGLTKRHMQKNQRRKCLAST